MSEQTTMFLRRKKDSQRRNDKDYFEKLSDADKEKILGKDAFAAYQAGDITDLKDFVGWKNHKEFGKSVYRKPLAQVLANQRINVESGVVKESIKQVGSGGYWKTIGEKTDLSVTKQFNSLACVPAVGEMLLKERGLIINQKEIANVIGTPSDPIRLAKYLNSLKISEKGWIGGFFDVKSFERIVSTGTWGAVLREGSPLGHLVMVTGVDKKGLIQINDPFDQTSYKMTKAEFLKHLSEFVCEKK